MSTAEKPPKLALRLPLDLDEIERMSPEERAELNLPDHTQLPDKDETIVENFQEHPQAMLLSVSIKPILDRLHPDGHYIIGHDCGIYWRWTDPPLQGVKCPDWCYFPGVAPSPPGTYRRSYVLWQEWTRPLILLEIVSGNGSEERDRTPISGKFWVYENVIHSKYYGIYEPVPGRIEMYHRVENRFERLPANEHGRYPIPEMGVELGLWQGNYFGSVMPWMRWWDPAGHLVLTGEELAEVEAERANLEAERANLEAERAVRQTERADLEASRAAREAERANLERARAAREAERANMERERAAREAERANMERERAVREAERANLGEQKAAREAERAERLAAQLRSLGIDPED